MLITTTKTLFKVKYSVCSDSHDCYRFAVNIISILIF